MRKPHVLRSSGIYERRFSELSPEELRGLEAALKKVGKRAAALMEEGDDLCVGLAELHRKRNGRLGVGCHH